MYEPRRMSNQSRRKVTNHIQFGNRFLKYLIKSRELPSMEDVSSSLV